MSQSTLDCMTVEYMGAKEIAEYLRERYGTSVTAATIRSEVRNGKLPVPDVRIGDRLGWTTASIDEWFLSRPGQGARTDLL